MVFSSVSFLFYFLPLFLCAYFLTPAALKNVTLLAFSLVFYAWGEPLFVAVLVASIVVNYFAGRAIGARPASRRWLIVGVAANLILLGVCKYLDFFIGLLRDLGWETLEAVGIPLPLGISFFTFQAISYLIDIYRGDTPAEKKIFHMGAYIAMFPQLIAGPIVRYKTIAADLNQKRISLDNVYQGVRIFVIGLAMKVLLADVMALPADQVFATPTEELHALAAWLGVLAYTFQIYFDFCGYSYMAIGLGLICGLRFPHNFNYPYISRSITEFWRRWHISLSSWFRDYLYIPLGGNRAGALKTYRNLIIVFLLCGIWHGAALTFVCWGLYQGLFLVIERLGFGRVLNESWRAVQHLYVFLVVLVGWTIFRAESLGHAGMMIQTLFSPAAWAGSDTQIHRYFGNQVLWYFPIAAIAATPLFKRLFSVEKTALISSDTTLGALRAASVMVLFLMIALSMSTSTYSPFIYFRF